MSRPIFDVFSCYPRMRRISNSVRGIAGVVAKPGESRGYEEKAWLLLGVWRSKEGSPKATRVPLCSQTSLKFADHTDNVSVPLIRNHKKTGATR
jgi:hypothetical protein